MGSKIFALSLLFSKGCWFAIQLDMMAEVLGIGMGLKALLGASIVALSLFGLKAISLFSAIAMPLLIGTMGFAFYESSHLESIGGEQGLVFEGISVAIACAITAVVDMPTYFRHARSQKDGLVGQLYFCLSLFP